MLHVTTNSFEKEVTDSPIPVLVMFHALWCSKCAMMRPIVEDVAMRYEGRYRFCEVEIEESPDLADEFEADIVPAFALFHNGTLLAFFIGLLDETVLEARLNEIFRNC